MTPTKVAGCTRVLAKDQDEYMELPIRDDQLEQGGNVMTSEWKPSSKELAMLNNGGTVQLHVHGYVHPPVLLTTKDKD